MASYLERLIKAQAESYGSGVTTDPFTGGFILPDGRFLNMGMYGTRGDDHRIITHVLPNSQKFDSQWEGLVHVARTVNLVRWQPENWSLGLFTKPTPQQLATIQHLIDWKRMANERGDGYSLVEIFPKTGKTWVRPFDPGFGGDAADIINDFFTSGKRPRCNPKRKRKPIKAPDEIPTFKDRKRWKPLNKHIGGGYTRGLTLTTSLGKYHIHQLMNGYWGGIFEPKRKRGVRIGKYERLVMRDKDGIHDVFRTMGDVRRAAISHYHWWVRY